MCVWYIPRIPFQLTHEAPHYPFESVRFFSCEVDPFSPSVLIIGSWCCHCRAENMAEDIKGKLDNYRTAPFDARFPNQNQTRNCWSNYLGKTASQGQTTFRTFVSVLNEIKTPTHDQSRAGRFAVPWTIESLLYCCLAMTLGAVIALQTQWRSIDPLNFGLDLVSWHLQLLLLFPKQTTIAARKLWMPKE